MESSAVSSGGALPPSLQLQAAQIKMQRKATEIENEGALQLIRSVKPMNVPENVGKSLNIVG